MNELSLELWATPVLRAPEGEARLAKFKECSSLIFARRRRGGLEGEGVREFLRGIAAHVGIDADVAQRVIKEAARADSPGGTQHVGPIAPSGNGAAGPIVVSMLELLRGRPPLSAEEVSALWQVKVEPEASAPGDELDGPDQALSYLLAPPPEATGGPESMSPGAPAAAAGGPLAAGDLGAFPGSDVAPAGTAAPPRINGQDPTTAAASEDEPADDVVDERDEPAQSDRDDVAGDEIGDAELADLPISPPPLRVII